MSASEEQIRCGFNTEFFPDLEVAIDWDVEAPNSQSTTATIGSILEIRIKILCIQKVVIINFLKLYRFDSMYLVCTLVVTNPDFCVYLLK